MRHPMSGKGRDPEREKNSRQRVERLVYLILVVLLALYGLRNSEAAAILIGAVRDAFSLLINHTP